MTDAFAWKGKRPHPLRRRAGRDEFKELRRSGKIDSGNPLADFGAEVVKVERPGGGDPLRNWGPFANGVYLWWKAYSRNKKSVTLSLGDWEGQDILKDLAARSDVSD